MASNAYLVLALIRASLLNVHAGDPDILTDVVVPEGAPPKFIVRGLRDVLRGAPIQGEGGEPG